MVEGLTAAARGQPQDALRYARATLAHAGALGISHDCPRWAWPLAARTAHDLRDTAAIGELLTLLDAYQPGHLAPMLRAERDLARARLAASGGAGMPVLQVWFPSSSLRWCLVQLGWRGSARHRFPGGGQLSRPADSG